MKRKIELLVLFIIFGLSQNSFADYPIVSHRHLADPASLVYNGRVYLYCSNDDENPPGEDAGYQMKSLVCVSSSDMKNWTDHGIVFKVPRDASWATNSWAPSAIERNGKFFLYFGNGASGIGVAVADSPLGPFKDPIGGRLVSSSTPGILPATNMWLFDPMTFIDDDGQAYLYCGGNGDDNVRIVKLNEDMISVDGSAIKMTALNFFEAAWMHKHNGKYYFTYSTIPSAGMRIDYMISDNPTSGFTYGGVVSPQPPHNNNNNHQAVFNFKDQWYQAYHNRFVAREAGIPHVYKRNLCVDQFSHNQDGTINIMENTTDGLQQAGYVNPFERVEAETMNAQNGIYTEVCNQGGMSVCNIENSDWVKVRGVDFGSTGAGIFTASIASGTKAAATKGGSIEIRMDGLNGKRIGTVPVAFTGGSDVWKPETVAVDSVSGVHDMYFVFAGQGDENLFNFDFWQFVEKRDTSDLYAINASIGKYKIDTITGFDSTTIKVSAIYTDGTSEDITSETSFALDQENLVSITDGLINGIGYGAVTVTATYNDKADEVKLIVKNLESEMAVSQLIADVSNIELFAGGAKAIEISAEFIDGHIEIVTDKVSIENPSPEVATLSNGTIKALSQGETNITVSYKGKMGETKSTIINVKVSNRSPYNKIEAEDYDEQSGTQTENCSDAGAGLDVGYIENGDWLKFGGLDFGDGATLFKARVSSASSGGKIELRLDSRNGKLVGTCNITGTGGWQTWQTKSCNVTDATGLHDIYLVFTGAGGYLFNINWWQFSNEQPTLVDNYQKPVQIYVIKHNNINYLSGTIPGDLINVYNHLGQRIKTFRAESDRTELNSIKGFVLIEVRRNQQIYRIKSII